MLSENKCIIVFTPFFNQNPPSVLRENSCRFGFSHNGVFGESVSCSVDGNIFVSLKTRRVNARKVVPSLPLKDMR